MFHDHGDLFQCDTSFGQRMFSHKNISRSTKGNIFQDGTSVCGSDRQEGGPFRCDTAGGPTFKPMVADSCFWGGFHCTPEKALRLSGPISHFKVGLCWDLSWKGDMHGDGNVSLIQASIASPSTAIGLNIENWIRYQTYCDPELLGSFAVQATHACMSACEHACMWSHVRVSFVCVSFLFFFFFEIRMTKCEAIVYTNM